MRAYHPSTTILCLVLLSSALLACGSERNSSGVWREVECDTDGNTDCHDSLYELHLGRYGQTLAGTVVRYRQEQGLDSYQRLYECGCAFVQGGRARDGRLAFELYQSSESCEALNPGPDEATCARCECEGRRFSLTEDGDELVGTSRCKDGSTREVRFRLTTGRPRTTCRSDRD